MASLVGLHYVTMTGTLLFPYSSQLVTQDAACSPRIAIAFRLVLFIIHLCGVLVIKLFENRFLVQNKTTSWKGDHLQNFYKNSLRKTKKLLPSSKTNKYPYIQIQVHILPSSLVLALLIEFWSQKTPCRVAEQNIISCVWDDICT